MLIYTLTNTDRLTIRRRHPFFLIGSVPIPFPAWLFWLIINVLNIRSYLVHCARNDKLSGQGVFQRPAKTKNLKPRKGTQP